MPRALRVFLLACVAIVFAYLLLHLREPLRLNVGDPSADSRTLATIATIQTDGFRVAATAPADVFHPIAYPPLASIIYGAVGAVGVSDIANLRILALLFSALAVVLFFGYVRRVWNDTVALVATALLTTSLLWMMFADGIHQVPIMQASAFLALCALVKAIDTKQRRYEVAAFAGSLACFLASYDYWLFLPAAILFTVHSRLGDPLARGSRRFVAICLAGCAVGIAAKVMFTSGAAGWFEIADEKVAQPLPTLLRRFTYLFTPLFWVTLAYTTWRAVRAPSVMAVVKDGVTWLLVVGLVTVYLAGERSGPHVVVCEALLPFYAIGSALLIGQLLAGSRTRRGIAIAWLVAAPAWSFYMMTTNRRALLDRDDVAAVRDYLAANDRNDFVMSNLQAAGPIEATFGRHYYPFLDSPKVNEAVLDMLGGMQSAGTDYIHAVIFTTPESRSIEGSTWALALKRHVWAATGWPYLQRTKTNQLIAEYDRRIQANLEAVHAKRVLHLGGFDVYRIDRSAMLADAETAVPVVRQIDLGSYGASKFKLAGWGDPKVAPGTDIGVSPLDGFGLCPNPTSPDDGEPGINGCETMGARSGIQLRDGAYNDRAQLMIRIERACDVKLTVDMATPAPLRISMNDFTSPACDPQRQISAIVPAASVHTGINIVTLTKLSIQKELKPLITTLSIEPMCPP